MKSSLAISFPTPVESENQGARRHHTPSMMYLGKMFLYGHGLPVDYDMALLWFEQAAEEVSLPKNVTAIAPILVLQPKYMFL